MRFLSFSEALSAVCSGERDELSGYDHQILYHQLWRERREMRRGGEGRREERDEERAEGENKMRGEERSREERGEKRRGEA